MDAKNQNVNNSNNIENYFEQDKNKWVPMLKYNTVKNKLSGVNPLFILKNEMREAEKKHKIDAFSSLQTESLVLIYYCCRAVLAELADAYG